MSGVFSNQSILYIEARSLKENPELDFSAHLVIQFFFSETGRLLCSPRFNVGSGNPHYHPHA